MLEWTSGECIVNPQKLLPPQNAELLKSLSTFLATFILKLETMSVCWCVSVWVRVCVFRSIEVRESICMWLSVFCAGTFVFMNGYVHERVLRRVCVRMCILECAAWEMHVCLRKYACEGECVWRSMWVHICVCVSTHWLSVHICINKFFLRAWTG